MSARRTDTLTARFGKALPWIFAVVVVGCLGIVGAPSRADEITFFHNDALGTPLVATNASGAVVWKESYRPYGERLTNPPASTGNRVWFTGKPQDPQTGLVYMGARYYDPVLGRFTGMDPAGFNEENLHSVNRYAYANNNPYKYVDRDGEVPLLLYPIAIGLKELIVFGSALVVSAIIYNEVNEPNEGASSTEGGTGGTGGQGKPEHTEGVDKPPSNSKPIDETPWSGNHQEIKDGALAQPTDNVRISPSGDVWVQNPDGTWRNAGAAADLTGSGEASGRRGRERDREREDRRERRREKRRSYDDER